jgi:hypothetical protein
MQSHAPPLGRWVGGMGDTPSSILAVHITSRDFLIFQKNIASCTAYMLQSRFLNLYVQKTADGPQRILWMNDCIDVCTVKRKINIQKEWHKATKPFNNSLETFFGELNSTLNCSKNAIPVPQHQKLSYYGTVSPLDKVMKYR